MSCTLTTVHDALGEYEGTKTVCKGAGDKSEDAYRPADPDDMLAIMLVPSDEPSHYGPAKVGYTRRHRPDNRYVRIILEFWEFYVVILENPKRYREA